ncbi:MAG: thioether cross-link-forming SCIFF peptide maturase [Clostridia bacterium]|jgi:uncharacterized protein
MIHSFKLNGTNIVLDVNSGAVHEFDDISYDVVKYYKRASEEELYDRLSKKYDKEQIEEAISEIAELEKTGLLFSDDDFLPYLKDWEPKMNVKALCLNIAHDCNLRCSYCFASKGGFGGERLLMSPEIGKKSIDLLIKLSGDRKNLEVDFFGGEPLLNFETVKEIIEYARKNEKANNKNFRFTITTNAVLLNEENMKYINENMVNVVLSIDGRESVNDKMRVHIDGTGTYKNILPKIKRMAEIRKQDKYYVRGTFTRENLDFSDDVLHLANLGFRQISVEPVVCAKGTGYDIREEDLQKLYDEYEKLAVEYVKRRKGKKWFNFFHFMIDLEQGPCAAKRIRGCGSGSEYLSITPEGDIYPCHQFVGDEDFKMGNVNEILQKNGKKGENYLNKEIQDLFIKPNVYTKEECSKCWAKFYCSGGCSANAYQFNKDLMKPYKIGCEIEKKRAECALWIKTQEYKED